VALSSPYVSAAHPSFAHVTLHLYSINALLRQADKNTGVIIDSAIVDCVF
jgi:hypothetical protein